MNKETIRVACTTFIIILWLLAFFTSVYMLDKIHKQNSITTYFKEVEEAQLEQRPQNPPRWEEISLGDEYTKNYTVLIPGHEQTFDGNMVKLKPTHVKINSDGFRDREFSLEKSPNTFRIIMLGDSLVFGWGVELEESIPKQLERILNYKQNDYNYEVLNFGATSHSTFEEVEMFKDKGWEYNPDLVIIVFCDNDFEDEIFKRQLYAQLKEDYKKRNLNPNDYSTEIHSRVLETEESRLRNSPFNETWKIVENPLEEIASIAKSRNIGVLVYSFKKGKLEEELAFNSFADEYENVYFKCSGIQPSSELELHPLDPHPTPSACKLHAEEIYETLIKQNLIPSG